VLWTIGAGLTSEGLKFYHSLGCFESFSSFTAGSYFQPVPEDWSVIITDVEDSTAAIAAGKYNDVNLIGAASLSITHKILGQEFPYVFGGDGATILLPNKYLDTVSVALSGLRRLAKERFHLSLRVGSVSMSEIYQWGHALEIAKYNVGPDKQLAIFRGDGLEAAENAVKYPLKEHEIDDAGDTYTLLEGLSCNWSLVKSLSGRAVALIVRSQDSSLDIYDELFRMLDGIYAGDHERANPVTLESLQLKALGTIVNKGMRLAPSTWSRIGLSRILQGVTMTASRWIPLPNLGSHREGKLATYIASMRTHTDYRKFDGTLRMVLDCSVEQSNAITEFLETNYLAGRIFYGTHISQGVLMTCHVNRTEPGEHIHFVDGSEGGYTLAAKQMKQQIQQSDGLAPA
jgi:hypothetical protein